MGSLEQLYQQVILDHAREKHGAGDPSGMDASSHQVNPTCGDEVTLGVMAIALPPSSGTATDARSRARRCP